MTFPWKEMTIIYPIIIKEMTMLLGILNEHTKYKEKESSRSLADKIPRTSL